MLKVINFLNYMVSEYDIWDIGVIKLLSFVAGLSVGAFFPKFIRKIFFFILLPLMIIFTLYILFRLLSLLANEES